MAARRSCPCRPRRGASSPSCSATESTSSSNSSSTNSSSSTACEALPAFFSTAEVSVGQHWAARAGLDDTNEGRTWCTRPKGRERRRANSGQGRSAGEHPGRAHASSADPRENHVWRKKGARERVVLQGNFFARSRFSCCSGSTPRRSTPLVRLTLRHHRDPGRRGRHVYPSTRKEGYVECTCNKGLNAKTKRYGCDAGHRASGQQAGKDEEVGRSRSW